MWISLLAALTLATQAPAAAPPPPLSVLVAPPDAAGAPSHVVEFAQEHVAEQLRARGLVVVRIEDITRKLTATKRRPLLRCNRTQAACIRSLGAAGKTELVLVTELGQLLSGYRTGARIYTSADGALVTEHLIPGVSEEQLLDSLTQSLAAVLPVAQTALRGPPPAAPTPVVEAPPPPPAAVVEAKPLTPEPVPERIRPLRRWSWLPAAGGVALAGAGALLYKQAGDKYGQLDTGGTPDAPLHDADGLASSGRRAQTLSRVAFGLGAAGLVAGAVMFLLPGEETAVVQPAVTLVPGGGMVGLSGALP
ncbi:hypothetical protein [Comamonas sp. JC664]|uniref:hypothetical protein n=1 Tax=Comamonas sp. JC664 TaxID=2801917 RepID=UPI00191E33D5|nr:hypothetical protein [Comamonas sp. JC664]MBL0695458.1 hypothetical protein [Comamonas sp. JC664]GHG88113.1 hypothetical protein GCM10012319_46600 [Comamonas sp. KCTC 72670]